MTLHSKRISRATARTWFARHFDGSLPLADAYYRVSGLQYVPDRRGLYLVAGENGLEGIYLVGVRIKAEAA
jgi:hypothetical protein